MSIKYYRLAKDETMPKEFCAIRDVGGEPSEYMFYAPESEITKLRELVRTIYMCSNIRCNQCEYGHGNTCAFDAEAELRELGVEV